MVPPTHTYTYARFFFHHLLLLLQIIIECETLSFSTIDVIFRYPFISRISLEIKMMRIRYFSFFLLLLFLSDAWKSFSCILSTAGDTDTMLFHSYSNFTLKHNSYYALIKLMEMYYKRQLLRAYMIQMRNYLLWLKRICLKWKFRQNGCLNVFRSKKKLKKKYGINDMETG